MIWYEYRCRVFNSSPLQLNTSWHSISVLSACYGALFVFCTCVCRPSLSYLSVGIILFSHPRLAQVLFTLLAFQPDKCHVVWFWIICSRENSSVHSSSYIRNDRVHLFRICTIALRYTALLVTLFVLGSTWKRLIVVLRLRLQCPQWHDYRLSTCEF